jgi:hypothetical protein
MGFCLQASRFALNFGSVVLRPLASSSAWLAAGALVVLSSLASSLGGCTGATAEGGPPSVGGAGGTGGVGGTGGGSGGNAGGGGTSAAGATLEFTEPEPEPLILEPREMHGLEVQAWPPGTYVVRFALLPGPALTLPGDAALSATDLSTNLDGRVEVMLTAPSAPTTFQVRASITGGSFATRQVTVEKTGKADLRVEADYRGERDGAETRWFASATPNQTCADLPGGYLDEDLDWTEGSSKVVELLDLPADTQLAVVMRAEHFAWGCATVPAVVEGINNHILVPVSNAPIQLAESEVSVSLDLAMFQSAFQAAAEPSIQAALELVNADGDDVSALLDRMQVESEDEASFVDARTAGGWDAALRTLLGSGAGTVLRAPLERWMRAGLANTSAGRFVGTCGAGGRPPPAPRLTLETFAGLPPGTLGISDENDATWYSSSPQDDVFFGTTLSLDPSLLIMGGALAPARTEVDGSETLAGSLASLLSCDAVAGELVARGVAASVSYAGCDRECARSECESAIEELVTELEERDEPEGSLEIAVGAAATVGPEAELVGLEGTWVGSLLNEGVETAVGGVVLAPAP